MKRFWSILPKRSVPTWQPTHTLAPLTFQRRAFPNLHRLLQVLEIIPDHVAALESKLNSRISVLCERIIIDATARADIDDIRTSDPRAHVRDFRGLRSLRSLGMQNGSQIRHSASNYRLHMAKAHQHVPGSSSGSGENPGEVLRLEPVTEKNAGFGVVSGLFYLFGFWLIWVSVKRFGLRKQN